MKRPTFNDLELEQAAACDNVCDHVDKQNWEDALLTLNSDAACGLEYKENSERYALAKTYFLEKAKEANYDLSELYADYSAPR